jgi:Sugar-transfer associated ATP-grasp
MLAKLGNRMNYRQLMVRTGNALKALWRYDICRLRPLGMLNGCYLRPNLPSREALHRLLWWRTRYKLPVLFWLPLELWRWIYWQIVAAPRQIQSAVLNYGPEIEVRNGIAFAEQHRNIGYWAKFWAINPVQAYSLGLFRSEVNALNLILSAEVQPLHRLMNEKYGAKTTDYRLLFDKTLLSEHLAAVGVPVVPDIRESDGEGQDLHAAIASHGPVFCKLRAGSRGESAFMAQSSDAGLNGRSLAGKALENEVAVMSAWKTLTDKGTVLIQPFLRNHPLLQGLSPGADSITLRVITRRQGDSSDVWMGLLYVQAPGDSQEREYWLLKIDAESGQAFDAFGHWKDPDNDAENESSDDSKLGMLDGQSIPFWQDVVRHSRQAHAELPRLWAIAWDWIITPDGPVLLEGNAGWDISPLQELGVDFVHLALAEGL